MNYADVQIIAKNTIKYIKSEIHPGISLKEVRRLCEEKMLSLGADSFWYWDIGAFVFSGNETTISVSGREYSTSDRFIRSDDIITIPESIEAVPVSYMKIAKSPSLKDIFTAMATSESGVLFNCSAGKDRTGVISAILLMLCGVADEEIVEDYMLTKEYNKERFKMAAIHHPDVDLNIIIPRESYIKDFMRLFSEEFGSVEDYFEKIGVTEDVYKMLRRKLKE